VETWTFVVTCIAALGAVVGFVYQLHSSRRRRLVELADLLADMEVGVRFGTHDKIISTQVKIAARLGRGDDLPKTRAVAAIEPGADSAAVLEVQNAWDEVDRELKRTTFLRSLWRS
jgi:hypothetical protein